MQKKTKIIILIVSILALIAILLILLMQRKTNKVSQVEGQFAKATVYTRIGEQEFDITNLIETNPMPAISAGMIPIKRVGEYWVIADKDDSTWCNYAQGKPAYMMLNDGVYQSEEYYQMPSSKKLAKDNIGTQIPISDTDMLGSIYMWIPKYACTDDGELVYVKQEASIGGNYTIPDCFTYITEREDYALAGIWVEVQELESIEKTNNKVTRLNTEENDITYGLIANTRANVITEEEKDAIQQFEDIFKSVSYPAITTINHTILKTIDTNKIIPIRGTGTCDESTGIATVRIIKSKNEIVKIFDEDGEKLELNKTTLTGVSSAQSNGTRNFYVLDNFGNIGIIKVEITGDQIVANAEFDTTSYTMTITVTESRFDVASIYFITKESILSENSTTGVTGMLGNGTYEFKITDSKGYEEIISKEVTGVSIFVIADENDLQIFKAAVATYDGTNSSTLAIQVADIVTTGEWEPIKNGWRRI